MKKCDVYKKVFLEANGVDISTIKNIAQSVGYHRLQIHVCYPYGSCANWIINEKFQLINILWFSNGNSSYDHDIEIFDAVMPCLVHGGNNEY